MELQAIIGQLYVIDGEVQAESGAVPGILAQAAPAKAARARERDYLFVHLTLTGQSRETAVLAQDLLDAIAQRYYQAQGSVTAALRQAIAQANDLLLRLNLSGSGPVREGAITCGVLRNGELFLLQTGESLALLGHNFGIERLPAHLPERSTPLGRTAGLDIRYYHYRLQNGDMLLLADPRLAHLLTATFEVALVDTEAEIGLAELVTIVGSDSARLLLLEFTDDAPSDLPEVTIASTRSGAARPAVREPLPVREGATGETAVQPTQPVIPIREQITRPMMSVDVENSARKATSEAAMGLARFTGWLADLVGRLRSPRPAEAEPVKWTWPALLAVVIPIIVALIVSSVYLQRGRVQRMAQIKQEMGQSLVAADSAEDDGVSRAYYQAMLALADEADTLNPGDDEIARLRQQAYESLDRLDGVLRLTARPLYTFAEGVQLTAVALQDGFNGGIYTLDSVNSAVYRHDTDESYLNLITPDPTQLTYRQQALGTHAVGDIIDMYWRPRGTAVSRDGLAMLDASGALLVFFPNFTDTRAVPLGLSSEWELPVAMATFDERLYVLDAGARQIWKYYPDGEGFLVNDEDRTIAFSQNPELEAAIDIDIYSEDASLLVVYGDGRIRYYDTRSSRIQWDETTLLQNGLNLPFTSPVAGKLVGKGLNTAVFVADPGTGRIVEIGRSGLVVAQYRATDENGQDLFGRITDFVIAQTPLRIFVTADNVLYVATLE
ncbi:MAG: hypothetical protein R3E31_09260 [Chloroflexota bacterium]